MPVPIFRFEHNCRLSISRVKVAVEEQRDERNPGQSDPHEDPLTTLGRTWPLDPDCHMLPDDVAEVVGHEAEDGHEVDVAPVVVCKKDSMSSSTSIMWTILFPPQGRISWCRAILSLISLQNFLVNYTTPLSHLFSVFSSNNIIVWKMINIILSK